MSFISVEKSRRLKESKLLSVNRLIDWKDLKQVESLIRRSGLGPQGYDFLAMLKALILQAWHNLSDPALEEALRVRLDFMLFTGFEEEVPDETTLCRFRNVLIKENLLERIFNTINDQLSDQGFNINPSQGAIIDATIIKSAARPGKELEGIVVDRREEEMEVLTKNEIKLSSDPDAAWLKKGKRSYFGYKGFIVTDEEDGYIKRIHVEPANVSEVTSLDKVIGSLKPNRLYGDKGYASKANREFLKEKDIKNGLMYKANKETPLTYWQKTFNKLIARRRYRVEQAFSTLKRRFFFERDSYFTSIKVKAQLLLKAMTFNLLKALRKVRYA